MKSSLRVTAILLALLAAAAVGLGQDWSENFLRGPVEYLPGFYVLYLGDLPLDEDPEVVVPFDSGMARLDAQDYAGAIPFFDAAFAAANSYEYAALDNLTA